MDIYTINFSRLEGEMRKENEKKTIEYVRCDGCGKLITKYEDRKNKGLCNDCVRAIN